MSQKREINVDFIKVISCCLVVALHTIRTNLNDLNFVLVSISVVAIPFFIVVNGYLMFRKDNVTWTYVGKKIFNILTVCFLWEALHAVAYFGYYHEFRNFLESYVLDFLQMGLFYHFWFMGTLIILYLLLPILRQLYEKKEAVYTGLLVVFGIICTVISIIMIVTNNLFVLNIPQSLRVWQWIFYYMLGGIIAKRRAQIKKWINSYPVIVKAGIPIGAILLLVSWQYLIGNVVMEKYVLEAFYGSFPIMISVIILFVSILEMKFKSKKVITYLSSLSMGIYIFHPFILAILKKFVPVFIAGNQIMNLLFWCVTVIVCGVIAGVVNKIPIMNKLTKL